MADNYAPILGPDIQDINRRRALAEALIQRGISTPEGTQFAGGAAVKNSPLLGIGNLILAGVGQYQKTKADKDYKNALASALMGSQSEPSPQITNTPQPAASEQSEAYNPYNDPMNPTGAPSPSVTPPMVKPQPAQTPQAGGYDINQILRMQQFPELKGMADLAMNQYNAKQKFDLEQQAAMEADKRARLAHQQDRLFDVNNPTDKTPAAVQEYEYAKNQGYKGSFTDYQKEQKTAVAQFHMDNPTPVQLGDPSDDKALAHGIATGQLPPLTGMASRSPRAGKIMAMVLQENPQYRGTDYGTSAAAEKFFTSGKGGQTLRSLDVAHAHLDTLSHLADALQNGNVPLINKISNVVSTQTGGTAPASFDAAKRIVSDEIAKAIVGGATALGDREEAARSINNAQTPAQLKQVIQTYQELMRGQIGGLADQYKNSTNRDDFYTRFSLKSTPQGQAQAQGGVVRKKYNPATGMIE